MTSTDFKNTLAVLDEFGQIIIKEYRDELEADNNANGQLYQSLSYTVSNGNSGWVITISLADYWKYVEYGRKPGKWPPREAIENWIRVKRILPKPMTLKSGKTVIPTIPQLSFLIARSIGQHGTKGKHYFQNAFDKLKAEFTEKIEQAILADVKAALI